VLGRLVRSHGRPPRFRSPFSLARWNPSRALQIKERWHCAGIQIEFPKIPAKTRRSTNRVNDGHRDFYTRRDSVAVNVLSAPGQCASWLRSDQAKTWPENKPNRLSAPVYSCQTQMQTGCMEEGNLCNVSWLNSRYIASQEWLQEVSHYWNRLWNHVKRLREKSILSVNKNYYPLCLRNEENKEQNLNFKIWLEIDLKSWSRTLLKLFFNLMTFIQTHCFMMHPSCIVLVTLLLNSKRLKTDSRSHSVVVIDIFSSMRHQIRNYAFWRYFRSFTGRHCYCAIADETPLLSCKKADIDKKKVRNRRRRITSVLCEKKSRYVRSS